MEKEIWVSNSYFAADTMVKKCFISLIGNIRNCFHYIKKIPK